MRLRRESAPPRMSLLSSAGRPARDLPMNNSGGRSSARPGHTLAHDAREQGAPLARPSKTVRDTERDLSDVLARVHGLRRSVIEARRGTVRQPREEAEHVGTGIEEIGNARVDL